MNAESRIQSSMTHGTRLVSLSLLAVILVASSSAQLSPETGKHQMSKKEVKALISNAKTAKDHREIAAYFTQQAQIFEKKRREYQARSAEVAEYPMKYNTKYPSAYDHCRFWAQHYALKSREAENTANVHVQIANRLADERR